MQRNRRPSLLWKARLRLNHLNIAETGQSLNSERNHGRNDRFWERYKPAESRLKTRVIPIAHARSFLKIYNIVMGEREYFRRHRLQPIFAIYRFASQYLASTHRRLTASKNSDIWNSCLVIPGAQTAPCLYWWVRHGRWNRCRFGLSDPKRAKNPFDYVNLS